MHSAAAGGRSRERAAAGGRRAGRLPRGAILCTVSTSAHHLALRYLLELSTDIHGAMLLDRHGAVLASTGRFGTADIAVAGRRIASATRAVAANGDVAGPRPDDVAVEVDVFAGSGAMFLVAAEDLVMACITARTVHPGLIFYDMHAVLRDLDRAAAAEAARDGAAPG